MLQRSGALDGKSADYNKIAKAVSLLSKQGVNIRPVDINKSQKDFTLDADKNEIHFGLAGVKGLKEKVIEKIIALGPFESLHDFIEKTAADIASITVLIKAGAFDDFDSRIDNIEKIALLKSGLKTKLDGQNLLMLSRKNFWPQDTDELVASQKIFNFSQYLKKLSKEELSAEGYEEKEWYALDDRACEFLGKLEFNHDGFAINAKAWKHVYDIAMTPIKNYLKEYQEEMLEKVNIKIMQDWKEKYFPNDDFAQWEIEAMGICFSEHPMQNVINVGDFDELPAEPEIATVFKTQTGRTVPLYRLSRICGVVIAKDKLHSSITLLTPTGPVEVKFRKEQFAHYDSQISQQVGGKKKVIERSWFNRGVGLVIQGMRQDDQFLAKGYKNSPMKHTAYKITQILDNGKFEVQTERKKGQSEESNDE